MPVTPFHVGPAAIVKAVFREKFSITVFAFSQILIDLQPLFAMLGADIALHGISHTYIGATFIAMISSLIGKPFCQFLLRWWNRHLSVPKDSILIVKEFISWKVAISSAFIGTYSHILLDSIMHTDLQPFFPVQIKNTLPGLVTIDTLHMLCTLAGLIGLIVYVSASYFLSHRQSQHNQP